MVYMSGMILTGSPEYAKAVKFVAGLLNRMRTDYWVIGDIAKRLPKQSARAIDDTVLQIFAKDVAKRTGRGWEDEYDIIAKARRIAQRYSSKDRREKLTPSHYYIAMTLHDYDAEIKLLERCEKEGLSTEKLKHIVIGMRATKMKRWERQMRRMLKVAFVYEQEIGVTLNSRIFEKMNSVQIKAMLCRLDDAVNSTTHLLDMLKLRLAEKRKKGIVAEKGM